MPSLSYSLDQHSAWRRSAAVVLALLVSIACGWGGYEYGRYAGGFNVREAHQLREQQNARIGELEHRNRELTTENARLKRSAQIDRAAQSDVSANLSDVQQKMLEINEELTFYRSLVAPGELAAGLHVQRLRLSPIEDSHYHYELVLTQAKRNSKEARGSIDMRFNGLLDDKPVTYALADVALGEVDKLSFKFKYFQSFEGSLRLPPGYRPQSVTIIVQPKGGKLKAVRKTLQWPEVISGGS